MKSILIGTAVAFAVGFVVAWLFQAVMSAGEEDARWWLTGQAWIQPSFAGAALAALVFLVGSVLRVVSGGLAVAGAAVLAGVLALAPAPAQAHDLKCDADLKGPFPAEHGYGTVTDAEYDAWYKSLGPNTAAKGRVDMYRHTLQKVVLDVRSSGALADQVLDDLAVCMAQDLAAHGVPGLYGYPVDAALLAHRIWACKGTLDCSGEVVVRSPIPEAKLPPALDASVSPDPCDAPWPPEIKKAALEAWYSTASPGEAKAVSQAVNEIFCWRGNPNNGWFGASITPSRVQGVARDACKHYRVPDLQLLTYQIMREYVPPCLPDSHFDPPAGGTAR